MGIDKLIKIRNLGNQLIYKQVFKRIFFRIDPEKVHDRLSNVGRIMGSNALTRGLTSCIFSYSNKKLEQKVLGIKFKNPIGLSAGFDKNARLTSILPALGFGFAEIGSITGEPCEGNPKPRLWRLKKSKSLVVYYGLKNDGCKAISKRLANKRFQIPIGISIAKTNCKETIDTKAGIQDYVKAYKEFAKIGAYYTINISCPNTFGGQPFTDIKKLNSLLKEVTKLKKTKPIFLKISPDLKKKEVDDIIKISSKYKIDGFICTNLTKNRKNPKINDKVPAVGGISGKVVEKLADDLIKYIYKKTGGKFVIIGCGGVSSAEDAYRKIKLGASLIQLITGMIFEGPQVISKINQGLVELLQKDGFENISQAVGKNNTSTSRKTRLNKK